MHKQNFRLQSMSYLRTTKWNIIIYDYLKMVTTATNEEKKITIRRNARTVRNLRRWNELKKKRKSLICIFIFCVIIYSKKKREEMEKKYKKNFGRLVVRATWLNKRDIQYAFIKLNKREEAHAREIRWKQMFLDDILLEWNFWSYVSRFDG